MKDLNWATFFTRIYYLVWAGIAIVCIAEALDKFRMIPLESVAGAAAGIVGPGILLVFAKWVFAGLKENKAG